MQNTVHSLLFGIVMHAGASRWRRDLDPEHVSAAGLVVGPADRVDVAVPADRERVDVGWVPAPSPAEENGAMIALHPRPQRVRDQVQVLEPLRTNPDTTTASRTYPSRTGTVSPQHQLP